MNENYNQKLNLKRKDQLKSKEDVSVTEAFEIFMLKNFFNIKLNPLSKKILNFWEKDFNLSIGNHINFLKKNLENQENYNYKFSEIIQQMNIFDPQDKNDKTENEQENNKQDNNPDQSDENQNKINKKIMNKIKIKTELTQIMILMDTK